jgi:aspartate racemase
MGDVARSAPERSVVGILGGMGPAATADFYQKLVRATPASNDQEHLRVVLISDPTVPDRSAAILGDGPDPTPWLLHGAHLLASVGAELIGVPCNTAHAFLAPVQEQTGLPIIHMIDQAVRAVLDVDPLPQRVGLLATTGTVRAGLYQDWFSRVGVGVLAPTAGEQTELVTPAILAVKSRRRDADPVGMLAEAGRRLERRGAQVLIAGCTEIPLVFDGRHSDRPVIDPTWALAQAIVGAASGRPSTRPHAPGRYAWPTRPSREPQES